MIAQRRARGPKLLERRDVPGAPDIGPPSGGAATGSWAGRDSAADMAVIKRGEYRAGNKQSRRLKQLLRCDTRIQTGSTHSPRGIAIPASGNRPLSISRTTAERFQDAMPANRDRTAPFTERHLPRSGNLDGTLPIDQNRPINRVNPRPASASRKPRTLPRPIPRSCPVQDCTRVRWTSPPRSPDRESRAGTDRSPPRRVPAAGRHVSKPSQSER